MTTDPTDAFDEVSAMDSKSIFKPTVVSLVVSNSESHGPNVMTASWWMLAGYNPIRYLLAVSHKTYTHEIIEENPEFVLAAPTPEMVDAVTLAGKVSGRELDKIDHLDLETIPGKSVDVPLLADAAGNIEFSVLDSFEFENCTYYFGDVEHAFVTKDGLDGRVLSPEAVPLAYMGSDWGEDDADAKDRYYLEATEETMAQFPGSAVMETLPPDLREKYSE